MPPEYNFSPSPESPAELFSFVSFVPDAVLFWLRELEPPLPDSLVVAVKAVFRLENIGFPKDFFRTCNVLPCSYTHLAL